MTELGEVFHRISVRLDAASISYMLVGSFASAYYGVLRATQDIDIVISANAEQVSGLVQQLGSMDYYADLYAALDALKAQSMFNVIDNRTGWKIDFIFLKSTPFGREAFRRRKSVQFQDVALFLTSAEDLVISKLEWAKISDSYRQLQDVAKVLNKRWPSLDREYLNHWLGELGLESQWQSALQMAGI